MGQPIYVEVTANSPNTRMMNLTSTSGGVDQGGYYLYWNSASGFTNGNVSWGALEPYIGETGWATAYKDHGYNEGTWDTFLQYLETGPTDLTDVLGNWPGKGSFVTEYWNALGVRSDENPNGCLSFVG